MNLQIWFLTMWKFKEAERIEALLALSEFPKIDLFCTEKRQETNLFTFFSASHCSLNSSHIPTIFYFICLVMVQLGFPNAFPRIGVSFRGAFHASSQRNVISFLTTTCDGLPASCSRRLMGYQCFQLHSKICPTFSLLTTLPLRFHSIKFTLKYHFLPL